MDSSTVYSFTKLKYTAPAHVQVVLTHLAPAHQKLLRQAGCLEGQPSVYRLEPNLEQGLRWCEEQLLKVVWKRQRYMPLPLLLGSLFTDEEHIPVFITYLEKVSLPPNAILFEAGDTAAYLYFLESGQVYTEVEGRAQSFREWT